jgi:hypothetical protein
MDTSKAKEKPEEENRTLDTIQTILDWLGLIPYIGDVIDAINAVIYFARGKYLEGALSLVAVIPFVGSVISITLKTGLKAVKGAGKLIKQIFKLSKSAKANKKALKAFQEALIKGKGGLGAMEQLAKYAPSLGRNIRKARNLVDKVPGVSRKTRKLFKSKIDEMLVGLDNMAKAANNVKKLKQAEKIAQKNIDIAVNGSKLKKYLNRTLPKMNEYISKAFDNRMGRMFGFEFSSYTKEIVEGLNNRLISRLTKGPTSKFITEAGANRAIKKAFNQRKRELVGKGLMNEKQFMSLSRKIDKSGDAAEEAFKYLKEVDPIASNRIGKNIGETLVGQNHELVKAYREAAATNFEKLKTMIDPTTASKVTRARKKLLTNYALWYNEAEDLYEKIGADDDGIDNVNGVVLANLYYGIRKWAPDVVSQAAGMASGYVKGVVKSLKSWGGEDMMADLSKVVGIGKAGPMIAKQWNDSYPGMSAEDKVIQTFKANKGKESNVRDNYIAAMNADGNFTGIDQDSINQLYDKYMETV